MEINLPDLYKDRMREILEDGYNLFLDCYQHPPVNGLRANPIKISPEKFLSLSPFPIKPVSWCADGFTIQEQAGNLTNPGKHCYHAAGLYYLQDPSAMAAGEILLPKPGSLVIDIAAAPGGKTTHLAALMQNQGALIANEIHPRRVWDLAENLERCGVTNAAVLNETPQRLAAHFGAIFDYVLLDAPCSGEGMFRKNQAAVEAWSPQLVRGCADRQLEILTQASRLVRPGGWILYSTCTFSLEENEMVIGMFLDTINKKETKFEVKMIPRRIPFSPAIIPDTGFTELIQIQLDRTARLWPHKQAPEGHFFALIQRIDGGPNQTMKTHWEHVSELARRLFQNFSDDILVSNAKYNRLHLQGNYVYAIPELLPVLEGLKVIHPGWWLGTIKTKRFEPSHALALGLRPADFTRTDPFPASSEVINSYLHGATLPSPGPDGWTAVEIELPGGSRFVLGWGKRSQGIIKNYYPRGLRWL